MISNRAFFSTTLRLSPLGFYLLTGFCARM